MRSMVRSILTTGACLICLLFSMMADEEAVVDRRSTETDEDGFQTNTSQVYYIGCKLRQLKWHILMPQTLKHSVYAKTKYDIAAYLLAVAR